MIARERETARLRQHGGGARSRFCRGAALGADHQHPMAYRRKWRRVQPARDTQHDPGDVVSVLRREFGQVAGYWRRHMRPFKPEMFP